MTKVVYNACYGGFGLSKEACQRYWELQGKEIWFEDGQFGAYFTVWFVPPEERPDEQKEWSSMTVDERVAFNHQYFKHTWSDRNVDRHDPVLVQVVEELGDKANGKHAKLAIEEVYGSYRIDEYDGYETVKEPDGYDWITP
jgi:fructosamine-3-kinase